MIILKNKELINLTEAIENYLETIAALKKEKKYARVSDIARTLKIKAPSVNAAVNFLHENGLVTHEKYGYVDLTEKGEMLAQEIQRKHDILYKFLNEILFVDVKSAVNEACKIEHSVSSETVVKLENLYFLLKEKFFKKKGDINKFKKYLIEK
jgi:DtxR family Mn-dependent transcriptional regulator